MLACDRRWRRADGRPIKSRCPPSSFHGLIHRRGVQGIREIRIQHRGMVLAYRRAKLTKRRALFTADIHCSNVSLPYAARDPQTLITDRLEDTLGVLTQMHNYALENDVHNIWILGDLLDKRLIDAVTNKKVAGALALLSKDFNVGIVPGNHEAGDAMGRHYSIDAFNELGVWVAPGERATSPWWDGDLMCVPYMPDAVVLKLLGELAERRDPPIVMLHQTIQGAKAGNWASPEGIPLDALAPFPLVLSGHFHTHQWLGSNVMYLGAPLQHHFGDAGEIRGFWDLQFDGSQKMSKKLVKVNAPRFHEIDWPQAGVDHPQDAYIKVHVKESKSKLRSVLADAEEACRKFIAEGARYARAIPSVEVPEAKQRIRIDESMSWNALISSYLDACCDVTGAARRRLEKLGQQIVEEADR